MVDEALKSEKAPAQIRPWRVEWFGSQGDFIAGKATKPVSLERFANLNGVYAVGPLEQARGEASIFDSVPLIAQVKGGQVNVDDRLLPPRGIPGLRDCRNLAARNRAESH